MGYRKRSKKSAPKNLKITPERQLNIQSAFYWIDWDFENAKCIYYGYGDLPRWQIAGVFEGIKIVYKTACPRGIKPTMHIPGFVISKATQKNAPKIFNEWFTKR